MLTSQEQKFGLSYSTALYKIIIVEFLTFSAFFTYSNLGKSSLSTGIYILLIFLGFLLIYPLLSIGRPLYILSEEGIRQKKFFFIPRKISWDKVQSISYPSLRLFGGKDAITLDMGSSKLVISLTEINKPLELLEALNDYKPYGFNKYETSEYLRKHFDREKIFYVTWLYILIGVAVLIMATIAMPYVWLEDNKYSKLWAILFFTILFITIFLSFALYKDAHRRKALVKATLLFWLIIFLAPFVVEENAYYNMKALRAEKNKDYISAEKYIRKAIAIHPEGYSYYETFGKILFGLGKYNESIQQFRFLLEKDKRLTDYYKAYYHLWIGKSLLKLDRLDDARKEFQTVEKFNIKEFNKEVEALL